MNELIAQLRNACSCIDEIEDNVLTIYALRLINYLSILTCWQSETCDNFLKGLRRESLIVDMECCSCCYEGIITITPFYQVADMETLSAKMIHREGIKDVEVPIASEDIYYSVLDNEIRVQASKYVPGKCCLPCPIEYKLIIEYEAGYELIPDCIINDFCYLLNILINTDIGCDDCCGINENQPYGMYLKSKRVGEISYTWSVDERDLDRRIERLLNLSFFKNLASLSLCTSSLVMESWGAVSEKCRNN